MSKRQPQFLIQDIIIAGEKITSYTSNLNFEQLLQIVKHQMP
jgi:uncharacterized protein with HEPN domain